MMSNESIRRWVLKFGPIVARNLRAIRPKSTWWHFDEMVVSSLDGKCTCGALSIAKVRFSRSWSSPNATRLRRGYSGNDFAAKLSDGDRYGQAEILGAALREIGFSGLHEQGLRANNRAEGFVTFVGFTCSMGRRLATRMLKYQLVIAVVAGPQWPENRLYLASVTMPNYMVFRSPTFRDILTMFRCM